MQYEFTSAALRALDAAARFAPRDADGRWRSPELLLALASEEESRAGALLAARQISPEIIRGRWPELAAAVLCNGAGNGHMEPLPPTMISRELRVMLRSIHSRLGHLEPFVVASDHLLWGLLDVPGEVSEWLGGQGFETAALEAQILWADGQQLDALEYGGENGAAAVNGALAMPEDEDAGWSEENSPRRHEGHEGTGAASSDFGLEIADFGSQISDGGTNPAPALTPALSRSTGRGSLLASGEMAVLRVLDAAGNRAREGLRVIEDYARFVLDDRHLTRLLKDLRHELVAALGVIPLAELLAGRDTQADVGVELSNPAEERRGGPAEIATANFKRVQEALRALEEFGKLRSPALGGAMKQLRYRSYTLERAVRTTARRGALADASLYVLLDGRGSEAEFRRLAEQLVAAGVDVLQLRDKQLDDRQLLARARLLREITAESRTLLIVNDRPDLAVLAEADGVHVGQEELSVHAARSIVGPGSLVGVSTHSLQQARQAVLDGADYIGIGPVFPSATKSFGQFIGVAVVRAVCDEIRLPAFAIGGIDEQNLEQVLAAGCRRVAVSSAVCHVADPAAAAGRIRERLAR